MESSSSPENPQSNRKKAIQELTHGQRLADHLREMLRQPATVEADPASLDGVVGKILGLFDNTISILKSSNSDGFPPIPRPEDSDESVKTTKPLKPRRGCYKRRKTSETCTKIASALIDDGHQWRKYGQKEILNTKHQRNYYRCTHKIDQGCKATKQVQKIEDEPPKFNITYFGHHTCKNLLKAPQIILDSPNPKDSSILLNFETKESINNKQVIPFSMKHEHHDDGFYSKNLRHDQFNNYSLRDLVKFDPSETFSTTCSRLKNEETFSSGVYSSTESTHDYEIDHVIDSIDFADFPFEFCS